MSRERNRKTVALSSCVALRAVSTYVQKLREHPPATRNQMPGIRRQTKQKQKTDAVMAGHQSAPGSKKQKAIPDVMRRGNGIM